MISFSLTPGTAFASGSPAASGRLDLGPSVLATCVLEKETLRVFYDNGDDFPVSLPFPVKRYSGSMQCSFLPFKTDEWIL